MPTMWIATVMRANMRARAKQTDLSMPTRTACRNYDEVIELYIRALKERWNSDKISEFGFEPCCFVSSMESDGYLLKDLDGDGNDELIILPRSSLDGGNVEYCEMLYAVYTMKNGKPIRVLDSWTRSRNYLCADGGIYNEGSDGASYSTWCIRDIKNGRIVVREGVQTTDRMDANGEYLEGNCLSPHDGKP